MATASVFTWSRTMIDAYRLAGTVLECGSRGDSVRSFFGDARYFGLDAVNLPPGRVDLVGNANNLPFPTASFDVVVSTEMLEHDSRPWRSVAEMARVVRNEGWVLLTARGFGYPRHGDTADTYRFSTEAMPALVCDAGMVIVELCEDPEESGVFCLAKKAARRAR